MSGSQKTLTIFAWSESPNPYVNVIAHCATALHVEAVEFIVISEAAREGYGAEHADSAAGLPPSERASIVHERVSEQMEALARGKYVKRSDGQSKPIEPIDLDRVDPIYGKVLNVVKSFRSETMEIEDLHEEIRRRVRSGTHIFDVTAVSKGLLLDVAMTLFALHSTDVYSFVIKRNPVFHDERDLIHNLRVGEYSYEPLLDTKTVRRALALATRWTLHSKALVVALFVFGGTSAFVAFYNPTHEVITILTIAGSIASLIGLLLPFLPFLHRP